MIDSLNIIDTRDIAAAIGHERESSEFRPTALIVARTPDLRFISVNPAAEEVAGVFWLPQGGIEQGRDNDDPSHAASSELEEELGISVDPESIVVMGGLKYQTETSPRDGSTKGKLLVACAALLDTNDPEIELDTSEVSATYLAGILETTEILNTSLGIRPHAEHKVQFSAHMLQLAVDLNAG